MVSFLKIIKYLELNNNKNSGGGLTFLKSREINTYRKVCKYIYQETGKIADKQSKLNLES